MFKNIASGEIDCPEGLFLDVLGVGAGLGKPTLIEIMYECSVEVTDNHLDRGDRYAFST